MLAYFYRSVLETPHAVAVGHVTKQGWTDPCFDFDIVVVRIVYDATVVRFAGSVCWTGKYAGGAMIDPANTDSTNGTVTLPTM